MRAIRLWKLSSLLLGSLLAIMMLTATAPLGQETKEKIPRVRGRCQVCHREEAIEWAKSGHAEAWTDEAFVLTTNNRSQKECLSCHAPDKILVTGFGKEPKLRNEMLETGVDCVACHQDANDAQHGKVGRPTDAHLSVKNEKLGTVEMCASCHAKFGTVDEWKQTKWANDPHSCVDCHMPKVTRKIAITSAKEEETRAHTFKGADPEMFKKGIKVEVAQNGDKMIVNLTSVEVGHNFPTGIDHVIAIVDVRVVDGGQEVVKHQTLLADDRARGGSDNRLKPGETREIVVPLQGKKGEGVVRILHKSARDLPDEKAKVLFETKVSIQ
ncbi:MAG: multiheme c-type cytochrome [Armatimonadota bacterium]|nr:multiheme c-type cytochrome [Armatimonadota bacterium]